MRVASARPDVVIVSCFSFEVFACLQTAISQHVSSALRAIDVVQPSGDHANLIGAAMDDAIEGDDLQ